MRRHHGACRSTRAELGPKQICTKVVITLTRAADVTSTAGCFAGGRGRPLWASLEARSASASPTILMNPARTSSRCRFRPSCSTRSAFPGAHGVAAAAPPAPMGSVDGWDAAAAGLSCSTGLDSRQLWSKSPLSAFSKLGQDSAHTEQMRKRD